MFGMDDYEQSEAYYADVKPDSDIFAAVQSCRERNMLSTDTENFKPDDIATVGFVATTAVLASGVDYSKYADGTENDREAIIKCAKETNICSDISLDENVLRQGVDDIYATSADEEETTTIDEKDAGVLLLSQYAVDIKVGDQYKIEAKDVPKEYDKKPIIWESEDTSVATISSKGVIDAKKAGKTTIYGRTEDGKYIGKCIVLVRD